MGLVLRINVGVRKTYVWSQIKNMGDLAPEPKVLIRIWQSFQPTVLKKSGD